MTTAAVADSVAPSSAAEAATRPKPASGSFGEGLGDFETVPHSVVNAFCPARAAIILETIE